MTGEEKTLWRLTLVALFFINGNFYQLSTHRQENRRMVGHFYDMKNRFWAVGCGLGCGIKGLGRL